MSVIQYLDFSVATAALPSRTDYDRAPVLRSLAGRASATLYAAVHAYWRGNLLL